MTGMEIVFKGERTVVLLKTDSKVDVVRLTRSNKESTTVG